MTERTPTEVTFRDPPPRKNRTDWARLLTPLIDRPGEWAQVKSYAKPGTAYAAADNFRRGFVQMPAPPDQWEFAVRELDGAHWLFVRFVGSDA